MEAAEFASRLRQTSCGPVLEEAVSSEAEADRGVLHLNSSISDIATVSMKVN